MNNLNSVLIEGHLVQNPQRTDFPKSNSVLCTLRIANNRFYKKDGQKVQETSFFTIDVWGASGENCVKYLKKGSGVRVVGRVKQERWKDAEEKNHNIVKIIAEHVDFLPGTGRRAGYSTPVVNKQAADKQTADNEYAEGREIISL